MFARRTSPPSSHKSSSSSISSLGHLRRASPSNLSEGWDADDEATMSPDDSSTPPPPLTVSIPHPPSRGSQHHHPQRPGLREILANTAPSPYTLAAFMAYLSFNHCLETLEFTMDAGRYKKHYAKMMSRASSDGVPPAKDREYVRALWQRLVEAYIQPNGSREVNLPSSVRDPIVNIRPTMLPPSPEILDPAVAKIYELMEESVLMPFLNSVCPQVPQTAHPSFSSASHASDDSTTAATPRASHSRAAHARRSQQHGSSAPPRSAIEPLSQPPSSPASFRKSAPSTVPAPPHKPSFNTVKSQSNLSRTASTPAVPKGGSSTSDGTVSSGPGMTDDSGSTSSPGNEGPITPPFSPIMEDDSHGGSKTHAHQQHHEGRVWKKLGRLGGMKSVAHKKSVGTLRREAQKEAS